jgi:hypothetical protein
MGRSGSTLLERMLGELPGTCSLGELVWLWPRGVIHNERCGCGVPFHDCPFWTEVGQKAFGGWSVLQAERMIALSKVVDSVRKLPQLVAAPKSSGFARALGEYSEAYRRIYAAAREVSGASVIVDSSKKTSFAYCLRRTPGVDLRLLHLVRDSRGVAYSWTKQVVRPEIVEAETFMPQYSPLHVALRWSGHNVLLELPRALRTSTMLLRYERFADDPRGALEAVMRFAGLPPVSLDFLHDGEVDLTAAHTVAGNPMRFTTGTIPLRRDEAWRTQFPARDRRKVTALTFPVALALGYWPRRQGR